MNRNTRITWVLAVATAAIYGVLIWYVVAVLGPAAGGLKPLDMRMAGYTHAAVQTYVMQLSDDGLAAYLGPVRVLDTIFPICFAMLIGGITLRLSRGWHMWSRVVSLIAAAGYAVMDLAENAVIAEILRTEPRLITPDMSMLASEFTVTKYVMAAVALAVALGFGLRRFLR